MGIFDNTTKTTGTQTGITTTNPYGPATGLLKTALNKTGSLFNTNKLAPYTPMNPYQQKGLSYMMSSALRGQPRLDNALDIATRLSQGSGDISSGQQEGIGARALGPSYAEQNLSGVASGSMIGGNDPNYERLRQRAMENASTEASMTASGMGRSGSDYHQTAVARQVGDTVAGMDMQRLQEQEARQMAANQQMDSARQAGLGLGLNAYNSASGIQGANQDRRFGATEAIPGLYDATLQPGQTMKGIGDVYQADKVLSNNSKANNLGSLSQLLASLTGGLGTQTSLQTTNGSQQGPDNSLGGMLGLGLGGLSLLKDSGGLSKLLSGLI